MKFIYFLFVLFLVAFAASQLIPTDKDPVIHIERVEISESKAVRQPRLNHKPFTVTVDVRSDVATDAVFKFFLGPKYDSNGNLLSIEDNYMNVIELDNFVFKLTPGQNKIERNEDVPATEDVNGGFPFQIYVVADPYTPVPKEVE